MTSFCDNYRVFIVVDVFQYFVDCFAVSELNILYCVEIFLISELVFLVDSLRGKVGIFLVDEFTDVVRSLDSTVIIIMLRIDEISLEVKAYFVDSIL